MGYTDHDHDKYITTSGFNKLTTKNIASRLMQVKLVTKTDFDNKLTSLNKKINSNKRKHVLVENELVYSSYFGGKSNFVDMMVLKIILYFNQYSDISKGLAILIMF